MILDLAFNLLELTSFISGYKTLIQLNKPVGTNGKGYPYFIDYD